MKIEIVPCLRDNYAYLLCDGERVVVVDACEAAPVLAALAGRQLVAILATHHHYDHVGGNLDLLGHFPAAAVYGHAAELAGERRIPGQTIGLADGEAFRPLGALGPAALALFVPGHTTTAVGYYFAEQAALFTGDTLFGAGCGRLFEGTAAQMADSLGRLAQLPSDCRVYCGHEYTAANLSFAASVEPQNPSIEQRRRSVAEKRAAGLPSVPSTIADELSTNPFLRTVAPAVVSALASRPAIGDGSLDRAELFARLRRWKDDFVSPP